MKWLSIPLGDDIDEEMLDQIIDAILAVRDIDTEKHSYRRGPVRRRAMTMAGNCVKFTTKNNVNTFIMWPQDTLADKVLSNKLDSYTFEY
ncbi:hypothetical protein TNCV_3977431 [Trichonephila clavipes]|nr:hypothetical protein TNCV_3977431 [Trichonephila clavipes]